MLERIDIVTVFPEWFTHQQNLGVTGRAIEKGRIAVQCWNPRDFTTDPHRSVDDRPYGGGPGMVMRPEPIAKAIESAQADGASATVTYLSPQGQVLTQAGVATMAKRQKWLLLCGRYEGIDERVIEQLVDEEISIGDYVLSGGELGAAVLMDAAIRLLPGVLGHPGSSEQDSFSNGLLDHPHYTRPEKWRGQDVPAVLLSGDHSAIAAWRHAEALRRTQARRPELLGPTTGDDQDSG